MKEAATGSLHSKYQSVSAQYGSNHCSPKGTRPTISHDLSKEFEIVAAIASPRSQLDHVGMKGLAGENSMKSIEFLSEVDDANVTLSDLAGDV